jgi:hypothetical protein
MELLITEKIHQNLQFALRQKHPLTKELQPHADKKIGEGVSLSTLKQLLEVLKSSDSPSVPKYLHELLQGSKPYHFKAPPKPRVSDHNDQLFCHSKH